MRRTSCFVSRNGIIRGLFCFVSLHTTGLFVWPTKEKVYLLYFLLGTKRFASTIVFLSFLDITNSSLNDFNIRGRRYPFLNCL